MTQGADPYGLQQPAATSDPLAGGAALPSVGYTAYDPITGRPLSSAAPAAGNPYQPGSGYPPSGSPAPGYPASGPPGPVYPGPVYPPPPGPPPVYPVDGQLPPVYPAQYAPGYPMQYPAGFAQGMPMVPVYGYPMAPAKPARPGGATAAAVLAFVQSGFVLVGGITMLSGATEFDFSSRYDSLAPEFTVVAIAALLAGGLLIAGGITLFTRKSFWMVAGCLLSLAVSVYFVIRISGIPYASFGVWVPILFAVLPIIALALTMTGDVRTWVRAG